MTRSEQSIAILSPHLDDAALSCAAILAQAKDLTVVTVFSGIPNEGTTSSWDEKCGEADSARMMQRRITEDVHALSLTSARVIRIDWLSASYREKVSDISGLESALAGILPTFDIVYAPAASGEIAPASTQNRNTSRAHPDHVIVRDMTLSMRPDTVLYADLPYSINEEWPFNSPPLQGYQAEVTNLDQNTLSMKKRMLGCYATQMCGLKLSYGELFNNDDWLKHELIWKPV